MKKRTSPVEPSQSIDINDLLTTIDKFWKSSIKSDFEQFVRIESITPQYVMGSTAEKLKGICEALNLAMDWVNKQSDLNATLTAGIPQGSPCAANQAHETVETDAAHLTPILLIQIPGTAPEGSGSVLMYGHWDKQAIADVKAWNEPKGSMKTGPFQPNIANGRLYGRGTADDGYALFFSIAAIQALRANGIPYPTVNFILDFDEEGGSVNLERYLEKFSFKIGTPDLCITLDSGAGDYNRIWNTTTERGIVTGTLTVKVLTDSVHSGDGSGIIPNPQRIMRHLLSRLEDPVTGKILPSEFQVEVPATYLADVFSQATNIVPSTIKGFPWFGYATTAASNPVELILNRIWRAGLAVTGVDGLPSTAAANNVVVGSVSYQLSLRLPPPLRIDEVQRQLKDLFEKDPPYGATVTYDYEGAPAANGWMSPPQPRWLSEAIDQASQVLFQQPSAPLGDGGTQPVLAILKEKFKETLFFASGVAGPGNNEHAANENLNIKYAEQLSACEAYVLSQLPANVNK